MTAALSASLPLKNKKIILGVSGSIAACKADRIIRHLQDRGADVQVLFTAEGADYFAPRTAAVLTGNEVLNDKLQQRQLNRIVHIEALDEADCILVAPATANRLLQLENPTADDLFNTVLYTFDGPVYYAPAMHETMWKNSRLQSLVVENQDKIITPSSGRLACGGQGEGRLPEPEHIVEMLTARLWPQLLKNFSVLISGGPTLEAWDDIRYLTNRSSGRMGEALARVAAMLGAEINYISSKLPRHYPACLYNTIKVETARDMLNSSRELLAEMDGFVGAAAVADYRPQEVDGKISSGTENLSLELEKNPDVISALKTEFPDKFFLGFAAQQELDPNAARQKLRAKKLNAIVLNAISKDAFGSTDNHLQLLTGTGKSYDFGCRSKLDLALQIWLALDSLNATQINN